MLTTEATKEQATKAAIEFVRDYALNGCQHSCATLKCTPVGNVRQAKALGIISLIDGPVKDDCHALEGQSLRGA